MNRWLIIDIKSFEEYETFTKAINESIFKSPDKIYYQILTPKKKGEKYKSFYLADEGSRVVERLESLFKIKICEIAPDRKLLTRVAGWSRDRDWMRNEK